MNGYKKFALIPYSTYTNVIEPLLTRRSTFNNVDGDMDTSFSVEENNKQSMGDIIEPSTDTIDIQPEATRCNNDQAQQTFKDINHKQSNTVVEDRVGNDESSPIKPRVTPRISANEGVLDSFDNSTSDSSQSDISNTQQVVSDNNQPTTSNTADANATSINQNLFTGPSPKTRAGKKRRQLAREGLTGDIDPNSTAPTRPKRIIKVKNNFDSVIWLVGDNNKKK